MMFVNWTVLCERSVEELYQITLPEYYLYMAGRNAMAAAQDAAEDDMSKSIPTGPEVNTLEELNAKMAQLQKPTVKITE